VSEAWKALERQVASILGGVRLHRGKDFSQELPDVVASWNSPAGPIAIITECKLRSSLPWVRYVRNLLDKDKSLIAIYPDPKLPLVVFNLKEFFNVVETKPKELTRPKSGAPVSTPPLRQ